MTRPKSHFPGPRRIRLMALVLALISSGARAGSDHDHGDDHPPVSSNSPKRQPDGTVFLPKPTQHQLSIRTRVVVETAVPRVFTLSGTVVMDPNAGGKVQAALAGRLEAGPNGLPGLGQSVRKGEVLAHVIPTAGATERTALLTQQAELRFTRSLTEKRLMRLKELSDTVPRKEIELAENELASLTERLDTVSTGLNRRDALVAPVSGVIASAHAVNGQMVDARELIFEIIDPGRLRIEALAYDMAQARDITGATITLGEQRIPLRFIGSARSLRDQALPLVFAGDAPAHSMLAVGQIVRIFAQSSHRLHGIPVPLAALQKNPANQDIVWVKRSAEHFEPRVVTQEPIDGASVAVTSGLKAADRVVTQGATLINQVR